MKTRTLLYSASVFTLAIVALQAADKIDTKNLVTGKAAFADANSGIATQALTRAHATWNGSSCGTYSGTDAVTLASGAESATLADGCYQYRLHATDDAGNDATATADALGYAAVLAEAWPAQHMPRRTAALSRALAASLTAVIYGYLFGKGLWVTPFLVSSGVMLLGSMIWIFLINPERSVVGDAKEA